MLAVALAFALVVTAAAVVLLRRRPRRDAGLAPSVHPGAAGLRHLATTVSDLSDFDVHLGPAHGSALGRKARLGALLDVRQP
jgi:hypothetical protein